jgi:hypothetical protein
MSTLRLSAMLFLVLLLSSACSTATSLGGGRSGSVDVMVTTTGVDIDPDGYTISLDAVQRSVPVNGSVSFTGLLAGIYGVSITDVAANCSVANSTSRTAPVVIGPPVEIGFDVTCQAMPE